MIVAFGGPELILTPATLSVTIDPGAANGGTITLPAVANNFHYVTRLRIVRSATAILVGTSTLAITTTNLPGALALRVGDAMAAGGTLVDMDGAFINPVKSSAAGVNTTIVFPAPGAAVLWTATAWYYLGA